MGLGQDLHLVSHVGPEVAELVLVPGGPDDIQLLLVEEDDVAVVAVGGQPGQLGRDLGDVVHTQVGGRHHHVLAHQQRAPQLVRAAPASDTLHGDAVGAGCHVELLHQGLGPAAQRQAQARLRVHQHVVAVHSPPARGHCRGLPAHNDTFGELFDEGDFPRVRHDVFSNVVNVHVQCPRPVVSKARVHERWRVEVQNVLPLRADARMVDEVLILVVPQCAGQSRLIVLDEIHKVGGHQAPLPVQKLACGARDRVNTRPSRGGPQGPAVESAPPPEETLWKAMGLWWIPQFLPGSTSTSPPQEPPTLSLYPTTCPLPPPSVMLSSFHSAYHTMIIPCVQVSITSPNRDEGLGGQGPVLFLIEVSLLYNVVLVSAEQQHESTICIHIAPPSHSPPPHSPPPHPSRSSQSI